ncbi:MAG: RNA polymerase factor sigma-54 [Pseudomonadota bacterium]
MALELKQTLRLSQQLVMTPQLQQAIKLLQLNRLELAEHIMGEMLENPLLEETPEVSEEEIKEDAKAENAENTEKREEKEENSEDKAKEMQPEKGEGADDINWENYLNSQTYQPYTGGGFKDIDPDLPSYESTMTRQESLADHLSWQLKLSKLSEREQEIAEMIIGNLDDNGYLRATVEDIAHKIRATAEEVEPVLRKLQEFDPIGVGARDLRECLLIQARNLPENELVLKIIGEHLKDLERKALGSVAKACDVPVAEIVEAVKKISRLEPKPGRRFYDESSQYITPDIYVYKVGDEYVIVLNEDGLPKLRISNFYQSILRSGDRKVSLTKEYINEKLRSALWLIRSIHQRQRTIYKVTESIVKMQRAFLDHGISALRPMVLRDVAEDIGMHVSTVSRVTSSKYIHTPQGIFELKYFFNSSIRRLEGDGVASEAVKNRIREIIQAEDARRPFSDQELVELLRQSNIDIARRTVAKYREMLGVLSSSKRKKFF